MGARWLALASPLLVAQAFAILAASPAAPLAVSMIWSPLSGPAPLIAQFSATLEGGSAPFRYLWTFGDGGTGTDVSPIHVFLRPGRYAVALRVTDGTGNVAWASTDLAVVDATGIRPSIQATLDGPYAPATVTFIASSEGGLPDGAGVHWDFDDGGTAEGITVRHTYPRAGTYIVIAVVYDSLGAAGSSGASVTIANPLARGIRSPQARGAADPREPIALEFPAAMNESSVEASFHLLDTSGWPLRGFFRWSSDQRVLTFDPGPLTPGGRYTVIVQTGAMDLYGNPLPRAFLLTFSAAQMVLGMPISAPSSGSLLGISLIVPAAAVALFHHRRSRKRL